MQPNIEPVRALSSLVDQISPGKLQVVTLYKLFSAIQQLHPPSEEAMRQSYKEYLRCRKEEPELDQLIMRASDAASFRTILKEAGCSSLLTCLEHWVETMNLDKWAKRKDVKIEGEPLDEYVVPLGYSVLVGRYKLESLEFPNFREDVDFPMVYDFLQQVTVFEVPEELPKMGDESKRLILLDFDPTRMTAKSFREECIKIIDGHISAAHRAYDYWGYIPSDPRGKSPTVAKKPRSSTKKTDMSEHYSKTEGDKIARAVWDVLTAETFEKAAAKAAEHQYLIEADTLRLAVRDVMGPLIKPEKPVRYLLVDGIVQAQTLED